MRLRYCTLLIAALLLTAAPAWAADAGAKEPGLMDLSLAAVITSIATFIVLVILLTKLAWKPILTSLQKREDTIRAAVEDAQKANEEARAIAAQYEGKLDHAKEEAQAIADEARRDAEEVRRRIEEDARAQSEATLARAVKEIGQAKHTAFDELVKDVTAIAAEAASRILRKEISPETNAALVDEVISDYVKSGEGKSA